MVRMTMIRGRVNRWDVGLLTMQTVSFREHPGENFGAIRLKRNVLNPFSYAGAMVTSRSWRVYPGRFNLATISRKTGSLRKGR